MLETAHQLLRELKRLVALEMAGAEYPIHYRHHTGHEVDLVLESRKSSAVTGVLSDFSMCASYAAWPSASVSARTIRRVAADFGECGLLHLAERGAGQWRLVAPQNEEERMPAPCRRRASPGRRLSREGRIVECPAHPSRALDEGATSALLAQQLIKRLPGRQ